MGDRRQDKASDRWLAELLLGEADEKTVDLLAQEAAQRPDFARQVREELQFSEWIRSALSEEDAAARWEQAMASAGDGLDSWIPDVVQGDATPYACDQVAKYLWDHPEAAALLQSRLVEDEHLFQIMSARKDEEAFIAALETRMWAETKEDSFVENFVDLLTRQEEEIDPDRIVAFPGASWPAVLRLAAVAAAVTVAAFFTAWHFTTPTGSSEVVASVLKASRDAVWSESSGPDANGQLVAGRYKLDRGVVALKLASGSEMTVEGPALFDVDGSDSAFVYEGVVLARNSNAENGVSLKSRGLSISDPAPLIGIDARAPGSTEAIVFRGDSGICLNDGTRCRDLFEKEAVKADFQRSRIVDIPFNPQAFSKGWELLAGVEKNMGTVRIAPPGTDWTATVSRERGVNVYLENESFRPEQALEVDDVKTGEFTFAGNNHGSSIQPGEELRSYVLQVSSGKEAPGQAIEASLTFDHPVVGVIFSPERLAVSDASVGTSFAQSAAHTEISGLEEGDSVLLSEDRRTLNLRLRGGVEQWERLERLRVLVALN